jgi:hypothetical protein
MIITSIEWMIGGDDVVRYIVSSRKSHGRDGSLVQALQDNFPHSLPTCKLNISEPYSQISRELDSSSLEYISSSSR